MLELIWITLFLLAAYCTKLAILDQRMPELTAGVALVIFMSLVFSATAIRPAFQPTERVFIPQLAWLCLGAASFNLLWLLLSVFERVPEALQQSQTESTNANEW